MGISAENKHLMLQLYKSWSISCVVPVMNNIVQQSGNSVWGLNAI